MGDDRVIYRYKVILREVVTTRERVCRVVVNPREPLGVEATLGGQKKLSDFLGQDHLGQLIPAVKVRLVEPARDGCDFSLAQ
jgi:hypothetical protein